MHSAVYPERSRRGYTLIELLIVISIIALLSIVGFANFKDFSKRQVTKNAARQAQSLLRLAQSNATSSTLCNGQAVQSWYLVFTETMIDLHCNPGDLWQSTYSLWPAQITITGDSGCSIGLPAMLSYSAGTGTQTLSNIVDDGTTQTCLQSSLITFTLSIMEDPDYPLTSFKVSKGGAIDVQ